MNDGETGTSTEEDKSSSNNMDDSKPRLLKEEDQNNVYSCINNKNNNNLSSVLQDQKPEIFTKNSVGVQAVDNKKIPINILCMLSNDDIIISSK